LVEKGIEAVKDKVTVEMPVEQTKEEKIEEDGEIQELEEDEDTGEPDEEWFDGEIEEEEPKPVIPEYKPEAKINIIDVEKPKKAEPVKINININKDELLIPNEEIKKEIKSRKSKKHKKNNTEEKINNVN
jgi:hypothetical protein